MDRCKTRSGITFSSGNVGRAAAVLARRATDDKGIRRIPRNFMARVWIFDPLKQVKSLSRKNRRQPKYWRLPERRLAETVDEGAAIRDCGFIRIRTRFQQFDRLLGR